MTDSSLCTCGHTADEHTRDHGFGADFDRSPRCTVCTCGAFDWKDDDVTDDDTRTRGDAVAAIEEAGLLDHDEDTATSCFNEIGRPFAVATNRHGTDVSFAFPSETAGSFCTHFADGNMTSMLARVLAVRDEDPRDTALLKSALVVLDDVASACDVDPKLRARVAGLDELRHRIQDRVGT